MRSEARVRTAGNHVSWIGRGELDDGSGSLGRWCFDQRHARCCSRGGGDVGGQGDAIIDRRRARDVGKLEAGEIFRAGDGGCIGAAVLDQGRRIGGEGERQPAGHHGRGARNSHKKRPPIIHDPCLQGSSANQIAQPSTRRVNCSEDDVAAQWRKSPEKGFSRECCPNATLVPARFQQLWSGKNRQNRLRMPIKLNYPDLLNLGLW